MQVSSVDDFGNLTSSSDAQHGFQMVNKGSRTSILKKEISQRKKVIRSPSRSSVKSKISLANLFENDEEDEGKKKLTDIDKTLSIESFIHEIFFPGNYFIHIL